MGVLNTILEKIFGKEKQINLPKLFEGGLHVHFHIAVNLVRDDRREP